MKNIVLIAIVFLSISSYSQSKKIMTPEQIVQENLDFYNDRNIEGFMSSFTEDIKLMVNQ